MVARLLELLTLELDLTLLELLTLELDLTLLELLTLELDFGCTAALEAGVTALELAGGKAALESSMTAEDAEMSIWPSGLNTEPSGL